MNTLNPLLIQTDSDGLTLREVIDSFPTDPLSLFAVLLVVGFFALILYFGTRSSSPRATLDPAAGDPVKADPAARGPGAEYGTPGASDREAGP